MALLGPFPGTALPHLGAQSPGTQPPKARSVSISLSVLSASREDGAGRTDDHVGAER